MLYRRGCRNFRLRPALLHTLCYTEEDAIISEFAFDSLPDPDPEMKRPSRSSQLSKTLDQVLHDKDALPHFIQFMESHAAANLVKFWLDADTFKVTSITRINSELSAPPFSSTPTKRGTEELAAANGNVSPCEAIPTVDHQNSTTCPACISTPLERRIQCHPGSVTAHGHEQFSQNSPSNSPTSVPKIACESASLASAREPGSTAKNCSHNIPPSGLIGNSSGPKPCDIADDREQVLPPGGSLSHSSAGVTGDSGSSHAGGASEMELGSNLSSPKSDVCPSEDAHDDVVTFQKNLLKSRHSVLIKSNDFFCSIMFFVVVVLMFLVLLVLVVVILVIVVVLVMWLILVVVVLVVTLLLVVALMMLLVGMVILVVVLLMMLVVLVMVVMLVVMSILRSVCLPSLPTATSLSGARRKMAELLHSRCGWSNSVEFVTCY